MCLSAGPWPKPSCYRPQNPLGVWVQAGEEIAGWDVVAVQPDQVLLKGQGEKLDRAPQCRQHQMITVTSQDHRAEPAVFWSGLGLAGPTVSIRRWSWGLVAGAVWIATGLPRNPGWPAIAIGRALSRGSPGGGLRHRCPFGIFLTAWWSRWPWVAYFRAGLTVCTGLLGRGFESRRVLAAATLFRASYRWIRGFDGLGFGDVKFVAAAALWVGIRNGGIAFGGGAVGHGQPADPAGRRPRIDGQQAISFGPHLAVGLWLTWAAGPLQFGI